MSATAFTFWYMDYIKVIDPVTLTLDDPKPEMFFFTDTISFFVFMRVLYHHVLQNVMSSISVGRVQHLANVTTCKSTMSRKWIIMELSKAVTT